MRSLDLSRRAIAEAIGTALLLAAVVGSGIMGERLAGGNVAIALLANSLATGAALVAILLALAPISGAQLNPVAAQSAGALVGVGIANLMFELPLFSLSEKARHGPAQWLAEVVATFGRARSPIHSPGSDPVTCPDSSSRSASGRVAPCCCGAGSRRRSRDDGERDP